jgi:hypothetical protein
MKEPARKLAHRYDPITAYGPDHALPGDVPATRGYYHMGLNTDRRELAESGLLAGERSEEVFQVEGGYLCPDALLRSLGSRGHFRKMV